MKKPPHIIVIGAGIAGLSAAYEAQKRGCEVTVLEKRATPGGRMRSERVEGYTIDCGAQFLSNGYEVIPRLIKELGLQKDFVNTGTHLGIVRKGKVRRFRYDNPFSLLFSGLLGVGDWLKLGMGGMKLSKEIGTLSPNDYAPWHKMDDGDAASWCERFYSPAIAAYFYEPMLQVFYFQPLEQTSRALPMALTLYSLQKTHTMTLRGGIGRLAVALADRLDVRYGERVTALQESKEGVCITTDQGSYEADGVIIAAPAPAVRTFYTPQDSTQESLLQTPYSSTINIAIALDKPLRNQALRRLYGIWVPAKERTHIAAITVESSKSDDRAPKGELLHIMLSGEAGKAFVDADEETIMAAIIPELRTYGIDIASDIRFSKLYRWEHAEPFSHVGRAQAIHTYRTQLSDDARVVLCGDYMSMPYTEGAAQSAVWAAEKVAKGYA